MDNTNIGYDRNYVTGAYARELTSTAFNQFVKLNSVGEPDYARQPFDNPPFAWPKNTYMDIAGTQHVVQRGYMRSLITDPNTGVGAGAGAPNRRLFFQFNPQSLQRSVQQSIGVMNPLLQDPAQLTQPIPGTASFGFRLMFNREQEVVQGKDFSGYYAGQDFQMTLPDGSTALTSQIGVLADLMVLDTITGQGLSKDIIDAVAKYTQTSYDNKNAAIKAEKERLKKEGLDDKEIANMLEYDIPTNISSVFNANIGNSAFLNPLPFRVMFSSLFMVEGLATSIDVEFQKFSRTMVPTMCTATINMYALYIGFAKKNTFLYDNLTNVNNATGLNELQDEETRLIIEHGIERVDMSGYGSVSSDKTVFLPTLNVALDRTDDFKNAQKKNKLTNVQIRVASYVYFHNAGNKPSMSTILSEENKFLYRRITSDLATPDDSAEAPLDHVINGGKFVSPELKEHFLKQTLPRFSVIHSFQIIGTGSAGNLVEGPETKLATIYDVEYSLDNTVTRNYTAIGSWIASKRVNPRVAYEYEGGGAQVR